MAAAEREAQLSKRAAPDDELALEPAPGALERPHFVEGELNSFLVRPMALRNFIGVRGGISAIPNDHTTIINNFFFEVEPQVDIVRPGSDFRMGLGVPLRFELIDTQGPVESCIQEGRSFRNMGADAVMAATGLCLSEKQSSVTENMGKLRKADWDEPSDFARLVRYLVYGKPESAFYASASRLFDQSLGHGTVIRNYNPNINFNTARLGATLDFNHQAIGAQVMANDVALPDVLGGLVFFRPFRPYATSVAARSLSLGLSAVRGSGQPRALLYEPGLFGDAFNQPIPRINSRLGHSGAGGRPLDVVGADLEVKVVRTESSDVKLYGDYQKMLGLGSGLTLGALLRFSVGQPATQATRARLELQRFDADYLPSYFDTFHDIFQFQYLPMAYTGTNRLTYYPTKLGYLEANRGKSPRIGYHAEITHTFLHALTLSLTARGWRPTGAEGPRRELAFPDYQPACRDVGGRLDCGARTISVQEPGFSALRLRAELPLRRFLQAFAAYEVFSTTAEKNLGVLRFDGDNEIFFSGMRLMILPVLFLQAEARRYFFLQRVSNVDLTGALPVVIQDQNVHSSWTYAIGAYLGYEFN